MRNVLTVLVLALSLPLVACGSDGGDENDAAAPQEAVVDREEYIARADEVCEETNREAKRMNERLEQAVAREASVSGQLKVIADIAREGYEFQQESLEELKAIPPPTEDEAVIAKLHTAYSEQTALVGRIADAASAGDAERFKAMTDELERVTTRARALAEGYGFKECGSGKNEAN